MRLLDATTLEFRDFTDDQLPPYVILSHTWGDEEVTYQEMRFLQQFDALPDSLKRNAALIAAMEAAAGLKVSLRGSEIVKHRSGYRKIVKTAKIARNTGRPYFWIDTCCIDKSSSAELQEAINSMFTWYKSSSFCVVYLESVYRQCRSGEEFQTALQDSKWARRGWTLQELIAPISVKFYDGDWVYICTKDEWARHIAAVTGISEIILLTGDLDEASVAQKMSWAATRQTTRKEDKAYSLMGLFGIHMPMLYGEGDNAFLRLQEEIIRTCPDDSIFAWRSAQGSVNSHRGLLANSPEDFKDSKNITRGCGWFAGTNKGLQMTAELTNIATDTGMGSMEDKALYFCALKATGDEGAVVTLMLRRLGPCNFARVEANRFFNWCGSSRERTFYIEYTPEIPRQFRSGFMHCFHLKPSPTEADYKFIPEKWALKIENVRPHDLWDPDHHELRIPELPHRLWEEKDLANYPFFQQYDFGVADNGPYFIGMVWLSKVNFLDGPAPDMIRILLGYSPLSGQVWCKILPRTGPSNIYPSPDAPTEVWRQALHMFDGFEEFDQLDTSSNFRVTIKPGQSRGVISHILEIPGLLRRTKSFVRRKN
ncbi:hypothetical protein CFE70_001130 [Pyrenophora teres f. teres 0-1]|uniref:Uncharacterized protein n=1 Tax=Pyrenophora teres f. teres (strain 0-1) TaxID=861557 RepID=E3RHQ7_PYRTT|nr:hypothetical protein PTT_07478 [Pyrenophora teres f. teres 0-1]